MSKTREYRRPAAFRLSDDQVIVAVADEGDARTGRTVRVIPEPESRHRLSRSTIPFRRHDVVSFGECYFGAPQAA